MSIIDLQAPQEELLTSELSRFRRKRRLIDFPRTSTTLSRDDYTVGWICALPCEMAAAEAMLDNIHQDLRLPEGDNNSYTLGNIGEHNIVIAVLPSGVYGTTSAAFVASDMRTSFKSIRFGLMVGIGGGVPGNVSDIRLGDIVVSHPTGTYGGVIQFDFGKTVAGGHFQHQGSLNKPPTILLAAVAKLRGQQMRLTSQVPTFLSDMVSRYPEMAEEFTHRGRDQDRLFASSYEHDPRKKTCEECDLSNQVDREERPNNDPVVHYGLIASGNQVMKNGVTRDRLAEQHGMICFEMEAAGLTDNFPCLVVRGICDYADSHKNKDWQEYAAAVAAAYAKALLHVVNATEAKESLKTPAPAVLELQSRRRQLLQSLQFDQIGTRYSAIVAPHERTCRWLLAHSEFLSWLDPRDFWMHHGFLWIKGKPGAGKSTLMKFAYDYTSEMAQDAIVISFFFNARGTDLERSVVGMYRALVTQLLNDISYLQAILDELQIHHPIDRNWTIPVLQAMIAKAITVLGPQKLLCFIDALDECEEDEVREMVAFFEHLGRLALSGGKQFFVCFSSRHFPHIEVRNGHTVILDGQEGHTEDIATYIRSKLSIGVGQRVTKIQNQILHKAAGVFIWVVLVVQILNKEYDRGKVHKLSKRVEEIPSKLGDLFEDILVRDNHEMEEFVLCVQWILYSKRPLSHLELYFAILSGLDPGSLPDVMKDDIYISLDDMERYILSASKGLAEVVRSPDNWSGVVQFIHESVREFLLKDGLKRLSPKLEGDLAGLTHEKLKCCCLNYLAATASDIRPADMEVEKEISNSSFSSKKAEEKEIEEDSKGAYLAFSQFLPQSRSRENMAWAGLDSPPSSPESYEVNSDDETQYGDSVENKLDEALLPETARTYLSTPAVSNRPEIDTRLAHTPDINDRSLTYSYPFLEYAVRHVFYHTDAALGDHVRQDDFLGVFPLKGWIVFNNKLQDKKPYTTKASLLYILACENLPHLIEYELQRIPTMDIEGETHRYPIFAAFEAGHIEALAALLGLKADSDQFWNSLPPWIDDTLSETHQTPLTWVLKKGHKACAMALLNTGKVMVDLKDKDGRTPLSCAAEKGYEDIVSRLYDTGQTTLDSRDEDGRTPLSWAAENGQIAIVKYLLAQEVDVNSEDEEGQTPLLWAAWHGHLSVVKLLLEEGKATAEHKDKSGQTPLSRATRHGHLPIVEFLLPLSEQCVEWADDTGRTPLLWAIKEGHRDISEILIQRDNVNLNLRDTFGRTPLTWAARKGCSTTLKRILESSEVDANGKDDLGRSALSYAVQEDHRTIVELLLALDYVDVNEKDNFGRSALAWAVWEGREDVVRLLLDTGKADIASKDADGLTPERCATLHGYTGICKLLRAYSRNKKKQDRI